MLTTIVCDWNRTLFPDEFEQRFFGGLCRRVFLRALRAGEVRKVWSLVELAWRCYRLLLRAEVRPRPHAPVRRPHHAADEPVRRPGPSSGLSGATASAGTPLARPLCGVDPRIVRPLEAVRRARAAGLVVVPAAAAGIEGDQRVLGRGEQHVTRQSGFTGTGDAGDGDQSPQGDGGVDVLQVVEGGAGEVEPLECFAACEIGVRIQFRALLPWDRGMGVRARFGSGFCATLRPLR